MQVQIKISGSKETNAKLKKLGQQLYMLRTAMDAIGGDLEDYYGGVAFASQGGVFGAKWQSLTRQYALRKAKKYPGRGPLIKTGKMMAGFSHNASDSSVTIYNKEPYFVYHQSTAARTKIPRRQMMGVNSAVKEIVKSRIDAEVNRKIKLAGL